jgi:mannosyltransferase OCH1-like enzyme
MVTRFVLVFVILLLLILIYNKYNKVSHKKSNNVIPKHVFQTWHTYDIPKTIKEGMISLRKKNPGFEYHFFDDNDCRHFIKKYFGNRVLNAYNTLIPGAYKADLWRYCVMYIKGGIYLDIKYDTDGNFKLNELLDQEYYVRDIPAINYYNEEYVFNAVLVSKPGNEIYKKCIDRIVKNVENRDYCRNCLDITGPGLLKTILDENKNYLKTRKYNFKNYKQLGGGKVYYNKKLVLKVHKRDEYYKENKNHYSVLYTEKRVFRDDLNFFV